MYIFKIGFNEKRRIRVQKGSYQLLHEDHEQHHRYDSPIDNTGSTTVDSAHVRIIMRKQKVCGYDT